MQECKFPGDDILYHAELVLKHLIQISHIAGDRLCGACLLYSTNCFQAPACHIWGCCAVHLKVLNTTIWSGWAVPLKSEQTNFSKQFKSAALHRILFWTCNLFWCPMFTKNNEQLQDCAKQWALLWFVTSSRKSVKIPFPMKPVVRLYYTV